MTQNPATRRTDSNLLRSALAAIGLALVASLAAADPDPPCSCDRYLNCGNGTVTDTATGLVWLQMGDCYEKQYWATPVGATLPVVI